MDRTIFFVKRLSFTLVALFILINANAQYIFTGVVKDSNQQPVPHCSIGIKNSKVGTVAGQDGVFKLVIPDSLAESFVIFSAIGFSDRQISPQEFKTGMVITLNEKVFDMAEVVIKGTKMKEQTVGQRSRPMITFSRMFDKNVPSIEQGNIFEIYHRTLLKAYHFYIIPSSKYASITLKLNVYTVKNNIPDSNLLRKLITYRTTSIGWQKIDLAPYHLNFDGLDRIAVTLQLVDYVADSSENFIFGVSAKKTLAKDLLFRYQNQGNWEASSGTFIANLDIKYNKDGNKTIVQKDLLVENSPDVKLLANYYQYKQAGARSGYGRNKKGSYVDVDEARIYTEQYGKGEPLILLHGNNGSIADFYRQITFFEQHFRVIAMDTRSQGGSTDLSIEPYTYDKFANDLYQVLTALNLKKVNIMGWSDGGNTALSFNLAHPDMVNKIVTIGANLDPSGVSDSLMASFKNQLLAKSPAQNPRLIKLMLEQPNISPVQLRQIRNPVLVVAGSNDVIKAEHTKLIAASIGKSQLEIIPHATHYVPFERPDYLNKLILNFLIPLSEQNK
ncbi:Pimeloyl-ACP methyl ester carboxylesterase [Pedobacter terrae]|uniref:Pimeloyl-ACP methyl ester carboxylesterase n=1 Tax=Pedobacter terrae TaxID=405671 RepID=A0A1G7MVS1_9SPHI|nr:alpha/beta fold hydrolase [Pedobacter terrae]SDF65756.1 Pimeloyl-ACP methyl ester carboxylesterase [Pedobacter terrae]